MSRVEEIFKSEYFCIAAAVMIVMFITFFEEAAESRSSILERHRDMVFVILGSLCLFTGVFVFEHDNKGLGVLLIILSLKFLSTLIA